MASGKIKHSASNDGSRLLPLSSDFYKNTSENMVGNPNYNWQCFNTLIFCGPARLDQGMVSITAADGGGFSKSQHVSLVLSKPFTTTLREKLNYERIARSSSISSGDIAPTVKVWLLQRQARLSIIESQIQFSNINRPSEFSHVIIKRSEKDKSNIHPVPPGCVGITSASKESVVVNRKLFNRQRKIIRKENKAQERDERKRRMDAEEKRKKQNKLFFDTILTHRDAFYRHHRQVKSSMLRLARAVSQRSDDLNRRKEREEATQEMARFQALKQNDMAAYTKLVQETKNTRLKFLLNQTDTYVSVINKMVQDQRVAQEGEDDGAEHSDGLKLGKLDTSSDLFGLNSTSTKTTSDYLSNTHSKIEKVTQPTMMRGGQLKEYQISGLQWLVSLYNNNLNGILADEMGLGKTIQTIALLTYVMEFKKNMGPFLIVVPLSTLSNWVNEATKWAPEMIKVIYKGIPQVRKQIYKDEIESGRFNLLLTTYEYIMKDKHALRKLSWQYIIVDEGHRMKNANSKFAQTLGTMFNSKHRVLLTGTPLQNNLPELWSLLNFLLPTIFSSVDTFDQWFNKPFASFRGQAAAPDANAEDTNLSQEERLLIVHRLHEVLRPFMLRRIKSQVLDQLPEKVEKVVHCELSGWQRKIYKVIHQRSIASKEGTGVGGMNNVIMHLRKICNHPYLFLNDWYVDDDLIRSSGKFELLDRMLPKLKAGGHRVLMFSQMTQAMTILEKYFEYRGFVSVRLDGSTSSDEREKRVAMFNDPESPHFIFLLSTRAGGLGLNLATADTVIIFDSDWNPMMDAQAQDRAHRIGQKKEVRVYRLVTNTLVEEKILSRAADKKNLNGLVVEAGKFNSSSDQNGSQGNREMMESLLKEWSAGGDGIVQDDEDGENATEMPDDEQLNELMALNDSEMELYRTIDNAREKKRMTEWVHMNARKGVTVSPHSCPKRLMEEHEQPSWLNPDSFSTKNALLGQQIMGVVGIMKGSIKQADGSFSKGFGAGENNFDEGINFVGGKAMRKRKDIMYDDHLTELQFQRMVEKQAYDDDKQQKLQKKANAASSVDKMSSSGLTEDEAKISMQVIKEVRKIMKSDGYPLAQPFLERPDKKLYPDYYLVVKNVVSFKDILAKLKKGGYGSVDEIGEDFTLLADNARLYNQDTSQIAIDAEIICDEFFRRMFAQGMLSKLLARKSSSSEGHDYYPEMNAPAKRSREGQDQNLIICISKSSYHSKDQDEQLDVFGETSFRIRKKKKFD